MNAQTTPAPETTSKPVRKPDPAKAAAAKAKAAEKAAAVKAKAAEAKAKEKAKAAEAKAKAKAKAEAEKAKKAAAREAAKAKKAEAGEGAKTTDALKEAAKRYVHDKEHKTAGGHVSVNNGDTVAQLLLGKELGAVYKLAAETLGEPEKDLRAKYAHLNVGMQRMNLGNRMRAHLLPKGK